MNINEYKMAVIRKLIEIAKDIDICFDYESGYNFADTNAELQEEILNFAIEVTLEEYGPLNWLEYLLECSFRKEMRKKFKRSIIRTKNRATNLIENRSVIEFSDFSCVFDKLNLEELKNSFLKDLKEFMEYEEKGVKYSFNINLVLGSFYESLNIEIETKQVG